MVFTDVSLCYANLQLHIGIHQYDIAKIAIIVVEASGYSARPE